MGREHDIVLQDCMKPAHFLKFKERVFTEMEMCDIYWCATTCVSNTCIHNYNLSMAHPWLLLIKDIVGAPGTSCGHITRCVRNLCINLYNPSPPRLRNIKVFMKSWSYGCVLDMMLHEYAYLY